MTVNAFEKTLAEPVLARGMAGLVVGETGISTVGNDGVGLTYLGYEIGDLCEHASFEEVVHLLLHGVLPTSYQLDALAARLAQARRLPRALRRMLRHLPPDVEVMDVLRTAVSVLGCLDDRVRGGGGSDPVHDVDALERLIGTLPAVLVHWWRTRRTPGGAPDLRARTASEPESEPVSTAAYLAQGLSDRHLSPDQVRALEVSLILYAEHEFNASTFTARVVASTNSDVYSSIAAAIGALKGNLHGGANEAVMHFLGSFDDADEAERTTRTMLAQRRLVMGFGHRVYRFSDPRSDIIKAWADRIVDPWDDVFHASALRVEGVVRETRGLFPNLDFYSADAYQSCGIAPELCTPLFVVSRTTGWGAHVLEQRREAKLMRPNAQYVGPCPQSYVPIGERSR